MRPIPGEDAFGRQRSTDNVGIAPASPATNDQMSFFLADEATLNSHVDQPSLVVPRLRDPRKLTGSGHVLYQGREVELSRSTSQDSQSDCEYAYSTSSAASFPSPTPVPTSSHQRAPLSRPITPMTLGTSVTGSFMSSPSSRRNSMVGSMSENALSPGEPDHIPDRPLLDMVDSGSAAPQLVMPSIQMPSRRPFTETGRTLGRLKILCAGKAGVGKTSLVKAMVQSCEHIVHVDPIVSESEPHRSSRATTRPASVRRRSSEATEAICEIFASTRSYPEWWAELDSSHPSHRRKSLGDHVLDRNICFVDTPGYGTGSSAIETIAPCVSYIESHLDKISSDALSETEMLNLLGGGGGGFHVDVVLYLIQRHPSPADIEYMRQISSLTNVIPLLAQSDVLSPTERDTCKAQIRGQMVDAGIRPFCFTPISSATLPQGPPTVPYAVSSANGSDQDIMDASLLMSPDYVEPLVPSELSTLVRQLFSVSGSSWLRHSAAKKYLDWRNNLASMKPKYLYRPLAVPSAAMALSPETGALISRPPLVLARVDGNRGGVTSQPPHLQLVDWAADLQRSLANEKSEYQALLRGQRSLWSVDRRDEYAVNGTIMPANQPRKQSAAVTKSRRDPTSRRTCPHQDPLGLLQVVAEIKAKGWIALEVLGSLGILGSLAYWVTRQHWQREPVVQVADDWLRLRGFDV